MVARGMGRHAARRLLFRQAEDGVGRAAQLEGARLLEVLALEEQLRPGEVVEVFRLENMRPPDMRGDALVRRLHILPCRNVELACILHHAASCLAPAFGPWR